MRVTMVKKRFADGHTCDKCIKAEELLRARGLWPRIDDVEWAVEGDAASPGMQLAAEFGVEHAPFFVVREPHRAPQVFESVLKLIKEKLSESPQADAAAASDVTPADIDSAQRDLAAASPGDILTWGLARWGASLGIAFSGAEDVALIDMAAKTGLPFSVFCLDTGRLHPETYRFIDTVRKHYAIEIALISPDALTLEAFVRKKGLFSFYDDGHQECCGIRKVQPLRRTLATLRAWATGQRRDQSPATRSSVAVIEVDRSFSASTGVLVKLNPLAAWTSAQTWQYLRENDVPHNALHERGFISIGCEPCTRATLPGEHERAGRWWWEESTKRECGLHVPKG